MKSKILVMAIIFAMAAVAAADSWTISAHYLRLNQANPSGNTDNLGAAVSYDWTLSPDMTFAVEGMGSWDNPAEIYGIGVNTKFHLGQCPWDVYGGGYVDWVRVSSLPSATQGGGTDSSENGYIYGPLIGMRAPISDTTQCFLEYRYGYIDGGGLPKAFDEANWFIVGLEMKF